MKINCKLTNSTEYNQFCCVENSVYTLKISKNFKYWYYDLCDLIDFYKGSSVDVSLNVEQCDLLYARELYGNHRYDDNFLREYESKVLVHSTPIENVDSILNDNVIKSWNILKTEKAGWEQEPIGSLLGDISDFSNYVMLSMMNQNNEVVTASKQKHKIVIDTNQTYRPGARFYLNAEKLAADGLLLRDGEHIKVKGCIPLNEYLIWYSTTGKLGIDTVSTPKEFFKKSNEKFYKLYPQYQK